MSATFFRVPTDTPQIADARFDPGAGLTPAPEVVNQSEGAQLLYHLQQHTQPNPCIVQFVACHLGEGTSTISRDLALIAAGLGQKVLLLDFGHAGRGGHGPGESQAQWLRDRRGPASLRAWEPTTSPFVNPTNKQLPPGIRILQAGMSGLYVSELTEPWMPTPAFCTDLFRVLRTCFDVVLVDSSPLDQSADALLMAQHVTTSVLVVAAEQTRLKVAEDLRNRIIEVGGDIAGVTLNRRRFHIPRWIYDWL
jgi:Mrp family chromosome partitioning ATPase